MLLGVSQTFINDIVCEGQLSEFKKQLSHCSHSSHTYLFIFKFIEKKIKS